jgi:heptaprenyl diphosphate synthase
MPLSNDASVIRDSASETLENRTYCRIALLVSLSCVLQISESMIPHPIPGLRLGLANMVTLVALVVLGFGPALEIALLRTLVSSLVMGTFMSPAFILSVSGAALSTLVMGGLLRLSRRRLRYGFSIIGISIAGALCHNMVQLYLAYLLLVKHGGIFMFFPWLSYGAVGMGWVTGMVAGGVCRRLDGNRVDPEFSSTEFHETHALKLSSHCPSDHSFFHRVSPDLKIAGVMALSLAAVIFSSFSLMLCLFLFLFLAAIHSRIPLTFMIGKAGRYKILILTAFCLPLFSVGGDPVLFRIKFFHISQDGLNTGCLFAMRIIFLILLSALLMRTTSPEAMATGISRILSPLKYIGISEKRTAAIISLSWNILPVIWDRVRFSIRKANLSNIKNIRLLIPSLSSLIAGLFMETDPESDFWKTACAMRNRAAADQHSSRAGEDTRTN